MNGQPVHDNARRSLVAVVLTAIAITVNHVFALGSAAYGLGAALIVVAVALLLWFRNSRSTIALTGYAAMSAWIALGFGVYKGLWKGVLRLFLGSGLAAVSNEYPNPPVGSFAFEASGILMFVGGLFVAYYGYRFVTSVWESRTGRPWRFGSSFALGATAAGLAIIAGYVLSARDVFTPPANGVVRIGVIAPTSGPYSILGTSFVKAVQMAQTDAKGTKYRYELLIEDSGPDPDKAVSHVRRVINDEKVDAVIGAVSLIGQVTQPFATRARIPHACVCTVKSIGDGGYNFTNIPSPEAEAERWVAEAQRRGIKSVGIIWQNYPSINNHVKAMKAEAQRKGLAVVYENRFVDTVRDFRPIISAGQAARPDVFYIEGLEPGLDILGQQLQDANVRNIASVVAPSVSEKPALFEGAWYTDSDLEDIGFKRRFEAQYPGVQFATHMMPYAYDSFRMIVEAYERGINPAVYLRGIREYAGTAGPITKAPGSGNFQSTPAVWVIQGGKPVLLDSQGGHTPVTIARSVKP